MNTNPSSEISSPTNPELGLQAMISPTVDDDNTTTVTVVTSPQPNIPSHDSPVLCEKNSTSTPSKTVLPMELISDDPSKHSEIGNKVLLVFFKILEKRGYEECLGHGKKKCFMAKINVQLHAADGPLKMVKQTSDNSFLKKIRIALKVLDRHLNIQHSIGPGEDGEEYPAHLKTILTLYEKIMAAVPNHSTSKQSQSEKNLVIQNEFLGNVVLPAANDNNKQRHSSRAQNEKEGHQLVARGDNSHNASKKEIICLEDRPFFKKKSTPNTVALIQDAQSTKMNFSAVFEQINVNQCKRDKNNESKLQLYHNRTELKRHSQEHRIEQANLRLKEKSNNRRFTNITSMIELTRKEIVLYKDMPEMRAESAERLRKYYAELETLNSQL